MGFYTMKGFDVKIKIYFIIALLSVLPSMGWSIVLTDNQNDWYDQKTLDSSGSCQARSRLADEVYLGPCIQNGNPDGRGLLITKNGVITAYADQGIIFKREKTVLGENRYLSRAGYLHSFMMISWASADLPRMPRPADSKKMMAAKQFIESYGANDPDKLVPQAEADYKSYLDLTLSKSWRYANESASSNEIHQFIDDWRNILSQQQLGEAQQLERKRFYSEYKESFDSIRSSFSAQAFMSKYENYDPDKLLPAAKRKFHTYQEEERRLAEERERQRQAEEVARQERRARQAANPNCAIQQSCFAQCQGLSDKGSWSPRTACISQCYNIQCN